jgi:hypothetical protein
MNRGHATKVTLDPRFRGGDSKTVRFDGRSIVLLAERRRTSRLLRPPGTPAGRPSGGSLAMTEHFGVSLRAQRSNLGRSKSSVLPYGIGGEGTGETPQISDEHGTCVRLQIEGRHGFVVIEQAAENPHCIISVWKEYWWVACRGRHRCHCLPLCEITTEDRVTCHMPPSAARSRRST